MLKISKLEKSFNFESNIQFVQTSRSVGAFGEVEVDGYDVQKGGVYFDNKFYDNYDQYVIEFKDKVICICNFEDFPIEYQQIFDLKKFREVQIEKEKEYNKYLELKQKFEKNN
jgi:hypothetical protein